MNLHLFEQYSFTKTVIDKLFMINLVCIPWKVVWYLSTEVVSEVVWYSSTEVVWVFTQYAIIFDETLPETININLDKGST